MASQTAVKMVVALAAGCRLGLYHLDFKQAFLNSPVGVEGILVELPDFPTELQGKFGPSRGDRCPATGRRMVGKLNKALYGLRDAPRLWQRHMMKVLSSPSIGVRFLCSDRNVFKFKWNGDVLFGCCHVDDLLFAPSSLATKAEFIRRIKAEFEVTGGDSRVEVYCGMQFRYDDEARTITIAHDLGACSLNPVVQPKGAGFGEGCNGRENHPRPTVVCTLIWLEPRWRPC